MKIKYLIFLFTLFTISSIVKGQSVYYYSYDNSGQLETIQGDSLIVNLSYDPAGNLLTKSTVADTTASVANNSTIESEIAKIYPNPAGKQLTIEYFGNEKTHRVQIFNLQGKLLFDIEMYDKRNEMNISGLCPAAYILKVISGQSIHVHRFIKY